MWYKLYNSVFPSSTTNHLNHLLFKIIPNFAKCGIVYTTYVVQKYKEIPDMDALGMEKKHIDILLKNGEICLAATERLT